MKLLKFNEVYINESYTFLASKSKNPTIINFVDKIIDNYYIGKNTPEEGEIEFQSETIKGILKKIKLDEKDIDLIIGSDLQNQLFASNFNASKFEISFLGIYSACASFVEGLIIASSLINSKNINNSIVIVSSNNLVSEKQYRFPVEYGALKKKINTYTATGSSAAFLTRKKGNIKIENALIGRVVDIGYSDTNNMGAAMASGVAETLYEYLKLTKTYPDDYDVILTGDLGIYGIKILKDYMLKKYNIVLENVEDAGSILYSNSLDIAGGSGPVCVPFVLFSESVKKYKNILVLASGSLHSSFSSNIKKSIPSISHAVNLKVIK